MALTDAQRSDLDAIYRDLDGRSVPEQEALVRALEEEGLSTRAADLKRRDWPPEETDALILDLRAFARRHRRRISWRPWLAVGAAVVGAAAIAGTIWWRQRKQPPASGREEGVRLTRVTALDGARPPRPVRPRPRAAASS